MSPAYAKRVSDRFAASLPQNYGRTLLQRGVGLEGTRVSLYRS